MLESLQQLTKDIGKELGKAWESLSEGWRELLSRSGNALTRFTRKDAADSTLFGVPAWGVLSGDVVDSGDSILVRVELPGIAKDDCEILVDGNTLYIRGEKRLETEHSSESYYLRQCAFGRFERAIPLPHGVDHEQAEARFKDGVVSIRLPKLPGAEPRRIRIG